MKRFLNYIIILLFMILFVYFSKLHAQEREILTKKTLFDIIKNIDNQLLSCIVIDGDKKLDDENKLDFVVRYIIENRKAFSKDIYDCQSKEIIQDNTQYYNFGKVNVEFFNKILEKFFNNFNYNIENYKYYNDGFVELNFEPIENTCYDSRKLIGIQKKNNNYIVLVEYIKQFQEIENKYYVQFLFSNNYKLKDINLYSSKK